MTSRRLPLLAAILLAVAMLAPGRAPARAEQVVHVVHVGGYDFPPFVENAGTAPRGVTLALIAELNRRQKDYNFQFVPVTARRRYHELAEGRIDIIPFECPEWEWNPVIYPVGFSSVFLHGGEVFIAPMKPGRGQDWFDDLKGKRLVGILGYHYAFAGFDADPDRLVRIWGIKLVTDPETSIRMIAADRADIAVVTESYLNAYLRDHPDLDRQLLVSTRRDQTYNHRIVVRKGGPIDAATIDRLLADMERDGTLERLWRTTGISR